jgi:hypothetical protein
MSGGGTPNAGKLLEMFSTETERGRCFATAFLLPTLMRQDRAARTSSRAGGRTVGVRLFKTGA